MKNFLAAGVVSISVVFNTGFGFAQTVKQSTPKTTPNMSIPAVKPKPPNACYLPDAKKPEPLVG